MSKRIVMTVEEQRLWQQVYAAAFAEEFERSYMLLSQVSTTPFDDTVNCMSAEYAATVADISVMKLRSWREEEDDLVGQVIDWPEDWEE